MASVVTAISGVLGFKEARDIRKQAKEDAAKARSLSVQTPISTESDAQFAADNSLASLRRRRTVASTVQGGQTKRNTLG